jgi:hypothetical protein
VTRSFFESLDLLRLRSHDGGSRLSTGRDTCFVNIVRSQRPKKARTQQHRVISLFVYERRQVRVGWAR